MSKIVELPNTTPFENLSFWKCKKCERIYVSLKTECHFELCCSFCYGDLSGQPIYLPGLK